jgi:hypothetical protein
MVKKANRKPGESDDKGMEILYAREAVDTVKPRPFFLIRRVYKCGLFEVKE